MVEVKLYDSVDDSLFKRNLNYDETNEKCFHNLENN